MAAGLLGVLIGMPGGGIVSHLSSEDPTYWVLAGRDPIQQRSLLH